MSDQEYRKIAAAAIAGGAVVFALLSFRRKEHRQVPQFPVSVENPALLNPNKSPALRHESIISVVGKTPLIRLNRLAPKGVNIYVKLESQNPAGSVKDRLGVAMIEWAEASGQLKPGGTVVELTSGNTGIGLAMVCAAKGYQFVAVMSEGASIERRKILRFYGAKVLTPSLASASGGLWHLVNRLVEQKGYFWPSQFSNEANAWIHRRTTGPEILEAMGGEHVDYFVVPYGTGGTLKGVAQYLREFSPRTKIVVVEPETSPILSSSIKTEWSSMPGGGCIPKESHPRASIHVFQGWVPDFISHLAEQAREEGLYDWVENRISGTEGMEIARRLAREEGIFVGPSGGGTLYGALLTAQNCPPGTNIVCTLADTAERYLSTPVFDEVAVDMSADEKQLVADIGVLTADHRLPQNLPEPNAVSRKLVADTVATHKVVVFAMESCEFCWTVKKLFKAINVDVKRMDYDMPEFRQHEGRIRKSMQDISGAKTFPQIFIGGKFIGGAMDAATMWNEGKLQGLLEAAGAKPPPITSSDGTKLEWNGFKGNAFEFIPKWLSFNPLRTK